MEMKCFNNKGVHKFQDVNLVLYKDARRLKGGSMYFILIEFQLQMIMNSICQHLVNLYFPTQGSERFCT